MSVQLGLFRLMYETVFGNRNFELMRALDVGSHRIQNVASAQRGPRSVRSVQGLPEKENA